MCIFPISCPSKIEFVQSNIIVLGCLTKHYLFLISNTGYVCILLHSMECRGFEKQAELKRNDLEEQISPLKDQLRTLKGL